MAERTAGQASAQADDGPEPDGEQGDVVADPVPLAQTLAAAGVFDRPAPGDDPAQDGQASSSRGGRGDSRRTARRERAAARSAARAARRDRIVEAPREPKKSWAERVRSRGGTGEATVVSGSGRKRVVAVVAVLVGAVGLICSIVLALGALLVALDATGGSLYDSVSGICDVLVGPLRDAFSFTGANADMKESLAAWGAGAIVYLVVGTVVQSMLRSTVAD